MTQPRSGTLRTYVRAIPTPAAGAEWSMTSDRGGLLLVRSIVYRFTTDATVASRAPRLVATQSGAAYWASYPGEQQVASQQRIYSAFEGSNPFSNVGDRNQLGLPTNGLYLPAGCVLASSTFGMQAGDQLDQIVVLLTEYMTDWSLPAELPAFEYVPSVGG